jgi:hypothetical protein
VSVPAVRWLLYGTETGGDACLDGGLNGRAPCELGRRRMPLPGVLDVPGAIPYPSRHGHPEAPGA